MARHQSELKRRELAYRATLCGIGAEMEQFQANCEANEKTDTGTVHELIFDWRCRIKAALGA